MSIEDYNYANDSRVRAARSRVYTYRDGYVVFGEIDTEYAPQEVLDMGQLDDEGYCLWVPVRLGPYEVCDCCGGRGHVVDPAIDCGGITSDEFADDPDFADRYYNGAFDITCPQCRGLRVVRHPELPEVLARWIAELERERDADYADRLSEIRFGC